MSTGIVRCILRVILCTGVVAMSAVGGPVTYSAVDDWSGANPSGPWSYMNSSGWGQPLSTNTFYMNPHYGLPPFPHPPWPGLDSWSNGLGQPDHHGVVHNQTGAPYSWITMVLPPDLLEVDPLNGASAVRFTSPQTGLYSVSGRFQTIDIYSINPVHLGIILNGSTTLLDMDGFGGPGNFGMQLPFFYSPVYLLAGSTLDFIVAESTDYTYLSTGLGVTIKQVPEPAAYYLVPAGLGLMVFARRRVRS